MATDKKGFILYADQKELFDQLPNDKAGELIKFIFAYVNDENPITEDLLVKLAFTPIKQQFKRDLKKWENTREGRSKAGKASAEARKKNKAQQELTNSTSVNKAQQTLTKSTVNDNVNVNVNVNVKEKEINIKDADALYSLYPSKTIRDGKTCQTKSKEKNKKKLATLLSKKEHTFESLKLSIESELNGKKLVNGVYEYLKNLEVFLGNLPDIDSVDVNPNKLDEDYVYYQWMNDPTTMARRILKSEADKMFKGQAMGGYKPKLLKSLKGKNTVWK